MSRDDLDRPNGRSRRRFLRAGCGALAAVSSASAGCLAALPPLGSRVRYGRIDVPESESPDYRRWLPDPSAFQESLSPEKPNGVVGVTTWTPGEMGRDELGQSLGPVGIERSDVDYIGVDVEHYDRVVRYGPAYAVEADVDRSAVAATLDSTGYEAAGTHREFDLYSRDDLPRALAVGDRGFVFVRDAGGVADAKAMVDAETGAVPRYHETSETFELVSSAAGANPMTWFLDLDDDHAELTSSTSFTFDDEAVYFVVNRLYPAGETPSKAAVKRDIEENGPIRSREGDIEIDGRVVTIEFRKPITELRDSGQQKRVPPHVTWGVDHDEAAETVTLTHEAGDDIPADELTIDYSPSTQLTVSPQFADEYQTVSPGDALTVDVSNWPVNEDTDFELRVVWRYGEPSWAVLLEVDR